MPTTLRPRVQAVSALAALMWLVVLGACGSDPGPGGPQTDACNNSCLYELGEICNEATGLCQFPPRDTGPDVADMGPDSDIEETGEPDVATGCEDNDSCDPDEYCDGDGRCRAGCREGQEENCDDCEIYPATCNDDLSCSPSDRVCVSGCVRDADCEFTQFCETETGLCRRGCHDNPDNCEDRTGDASFSCNIGTRQCLGGACADSEGCISGAYCNGGRCIWGCRVGGDDCGTGQVCDADRGECVSSACVCGAGETDEACDSLCDEDGQITALYCDRDADSCQFGCRIFDAGTADERDNCRPGTLCDAGTRTCVDGCRDDATCPFGTYCDEGLCATGCKEGECFEPTFCNLETRTCDSESCAGDSDCPDSAYCTSIDFCADGCRTDDESTTEIDEDNCFGELVCNPASHACTVPFCDSHDDCPLGQVCVGEACVLGCAGLDDRCPEGQPCNLQTQQCGCLSDSNCQPEQHCAVPVCEPDCVPDNPSTVEVNEDNCPTPLSCNSESGSCGTDCEDPAEEVQRNDFPEDATCTLFTGEDLNDLAQISLCQGVPELSQCDGGGDAGTPGTWCRSGVACAGQDEDWHTMFLYPGDTISAWTGALPPATPFVMALSFEDNPVQVIRGATPTDGGGVGLEDVVITEMGQYFLRLFAISDSAVPYDLHIEVDRVFFCREDIYDPAGDNPTGAAPVLANGPEPRSEVGLYVCSGDRDFFGIELFAGNDFDAEVQWSQVGEQLTFDLGNANVAETDIGGTIFGVGDAESVILDVSDVPATDAYFLRVQSTDPEGETSYSLTYTTLQGAAECENDTLEPNDTVEEASGNNDVRFRIDALSVSQTFEGARLCSEGDVDLFRVEVTPSSGGGFISATLFQPSDPARLSVELLDDDLSTLLAGPTNGLLGFGPLAGSTVYYIRVRAADGVTLPWQGVAYDLQLDYTPSFCSDDGFEPNDTPDRSKSLHPTVLLGEGSPCGAQAFTEECAGASSCFCSNTELLRLCPADADWYRFSLLVGDNFTVRVTPGSADDLFNITGLLYPPDCDLDDPSCDGVSFLASDGTHLASPTLAVTPEPGQIIIEYFLQIEHITGEAIDYEVLIEVQGSGSRDCVADIWDEEEYDRYPGVNDTDAPPDPGCEESSCTLTLVGDNNTRSGQLCFWDQQDFFRFDVPDGEDRLLLLEFFEDEGAMQGTLWRDVAGTLIAVDPLIERGPERSFPEGWDRVFRGLSGGTYQLEVFMPGRGGPFLGSRPNSYDVFLESFICGDGIWSNGEGCDTSSPVSVSIMCGAGGTCSNCECD